MAEVVWPVHTVQAIHHRHLVVPALPRLWQRYGVHRCWCKWRDEGRLEDRVTLMEGMEPSISGYSELMMNTFTSFHAWEPSVACRFIAVGGRGAPAERAVRAVRGGVAPSGAVGRRWLLKPPLGENPRVGGGQTTGQRPS